MEVTAQLNRLRIAPRKVRVLAKILKGMDLDKARFQLSYLTKRSGSPLKKLINSAAANARNNFSMVENNLYIKDVIVNEGMKLKRFRPKGFGRTALIQKKTSNIKIVLEEKVPNLRENSRPGAEVAPQRVERLSQGTKEYSQSQRKATSERGRPEIKKEIGRKNALEGIKNVGRRLFQRKSI